MQNAIQQGLNDIDPYVKKTAITGCIKFFHIAKSEFKSTYLCLNYCFRN